VDQETRVPLDGDRGNRLIHELGNTFTLLASAPKRKPSIAPLRTSPDKKSVHGAFGGVPATSYPAFGGGAVAPAYVGGAPPAYGGGAVAPAYGGGAVAPAFGGGPGGMQAVAYLAQHYPHLLPQLLAGGT